MVRNAWLTVHIVLVLLGYAALAFTAVASVLYLFQERELKTKKPRKFYYRLPPLGTLDDLISKTMAVGFVLITLAVIAGSTWGFIELKTAWIRQPKIAISFFTWGVYLALVCLRVAAGWRGRKAAIMTVALVGFSAITWAAHARLGSGDFMVGMGGVLRLEVIDMARLPGWVFRKEGGLPEAEAVSDPHQPPVLVRWPGTEVPRVLSQPTGSKAVRYLECRVRNPELSPE